MSQTLSDQISDNIEIYKEKLELFLTFNFRLANLQTISS